MGDLEHLADTPSTAEEEVETGEKGVFGCGSGTTTFQCSAYDIWDPNPQTYTVPIGDFCSEPKLPNCASAEANADALTVDINDGEGTECTLDLQNSPGTQNTV